MSGYVTDKKKKYTLRGLIANILLKVFWLLPIKKKIVFTSYYGKQYSDNPRCIYEKMRQLRSDIEYVWFMSDKATVKGAKVVPYFSVRAIYHLATSRMWIDNSRKNNWVEKRNGQIYIQTWHGDVCIKMIEKDAAASLGEEYVSAAMNDSSIADLMISGSKFRSKSYKESFWYSGEILELGTPKSDVLYWDQNAAKQKVCSHYHLETSLRIALYVPTFRDSGDISCYSVDYERVMNTLEKRWGGQWVFIVRLHPYVQDLKDKVIYTGKVLNGTEYESCDELIISSDLIITDYSGTMFSGLEANKKVLLFATDYYDYKNERSTYFDIKALPFPFSESNDQLIDNINSFDEKLYNQECAALKSQLGFFNSAESTDKVVDELLRRFDMFETKK